MQKNGDRPLIIAHRGASALAPENSLAAFERAINDGADGLEFDVRLAKDGVPVVFHDASLRRVANKEHQISSLTSDELQTVDIGSWFNQKHPNRAQRGFSSETVPTLAQFFGFLGDYKGLLYVELKCRNSQIVPLVEAVVKLIRQCRFIPQIILKSFKLDAVAHSNRIMPELNTAALFAPKIMTILRKQTRLIDKAQECNARELSLHYSLATQKVISRAEEYGMPTTIWTADHPVWVKRARDLGIRSIITNNPARLLAKRHEMLRKNSILA